MSHNLLLITLLAIAAWGAVFLAGIGLWWLLGWR